jgi:hypothetical protein
MWKTAIFALVDFYSLRLTYKRMRQWVNFIINLYILDLDVRLLSSTTYYYLVQKSSSLVTGVASELSSSSGPLSSMEYI